MSKHLFKKWCDAGRRPCTSPQDPEPNAGHDDGQCCLLHGCPVQEGYQTSVFGGQLRGGSALERPTQREGCVWLELRMSCLQSQKHCSIHVRFMCLAGALSQPRSLQMQWTPSVSRALKVHKPTSKQPRFQNPKTPEASFFLWVVSSSSSRTCVLAASACLR